MIRPGDHVTYRLTYALPTSNEEALAFTDYLPLPVFPVEDPDGNGVAGPALVFNDTKSAVPPAPGAACFGPADTFRAYSGIVPTVTSDPVNNSFNLDYGTYDNPASLPTVVDLLFTVTASVDPAADNDHLTNEVLAFERSTNAGPAETYAIATYSLNFQTDLSITKTDGSPTYTQGSPISYTLVVSNSGPLDATGASIADAVPAAITGVTASCVAGGTAGCGVNATLGNNVSFLNVNVPAGAANTLTITVNGTVSPSASGDLVNTAAVTPATGQTDPDMADNTATDTDLDATPPTVIPGPNTVPANDALLTAGISNMRLQFNKDVVHDGSADAANNPANYLLVEDGPNGIFNTGACGPLGKFGLTPDDLRIPVDSVLYDAVNFVATLNINGGAPLPDGRYRLFVCGTTSIHDPAGNVLNGGANSVITFTVSVPATAAPIPNTGFAPDRVSLLPPQNVAYTGFSTASNPGLGDLWLEIPHLGVKMPIVGVPQTGGEWDVSWLGSEAGWLNGSAFPTHAGNSVITGHVVDAYGQPGPFARLNSLWWGDRLIVHAWGGEYVYEVRSVTQVSPGNIGAMLKHEELPWVTLVTCRGYDEAGNSYKYRVLVRAVLVEVK